MVQVPILFAKGQLLELPTNVIPAPMQAADVAVAPL
jgi:hypothetical protein